MSTALLTRPRGGQALLSDQAYGQYTYTSQSPRRRSAPPISMEASETFTIPFGSDGFFLFEEEPPTWFLPLLQQICQLGDLRSNWDSYGAWPLDPPTAAHAVTILLESLTANDPKPSVVPTSGGGLMIEWHLGGVDLEIEVQSPSSVHVAFEVDGADGEVENASLELIQEKVNILRGRK